MLHHVVIGSGRPVMLFHGHTRTMDHRYMLETFEPIFDGLDGWQRIYVDLPGHGRSPGDDAINSQEDVVNAVIDFATTTFPDQSFALIGVSRGSYIARGFAYLRPDLVDGLHLTAYGGSPSGSADRLPKRETLVSDPALRSEIAQSELEWFDGLVVQNRNLVERWRRSSGPPVLHHDVAQEARVWKAFDFPFDLNGPDGVFAKPTLIVAGRQDSIAGYLDAIDCLPAYPRASLAVLDTAGHGVARERPEIFEALTKDWLERLQLSFADH